MTLLEVLLVIALAALVGIVFYYIFKTTGPWGSFLAFILILILAGIAAEAWIPDAGPVYYDVAWIPTLFVIILFPLLLASASPPRRDLETRSAAAETPVESREASVLGVFFWIFMIFLLVAVLFGLFLPA